MSKTEFKTQFPTGF